MRKIGILFVHGMGEQQRFDHLKTSVEEFAELIKGDGKRRVSVVDRTADWKRAPDDPEFGADAKAPMTLHIRGNAPDTGLQVDCHEVWWADLGAKTSLTETIGFWWWGVGQWAAPIYRELDPTGMTVSPETLSTADQAPDAGEEPVVLMPRSADDFFGDFWVRARLGAAGVATILTVFSWSLLKRLVSAFANAPSSTLIVQYLGDVRTYERRAYPNQSLPSDPGQPVRVAIRRRMVAQMVAMATRGYDHWCIAAHSLGSVPAYNGLTETGHALPNYLRQESWAALPGRFKHDPQQRRRRSSMMHLMMPARPAWLDDDDRISRKRIFADLRCVLTYGSPLDKFAAIWPRIVATADDRDPEDSDAARPRSAFPGTCKWVNLYSHSDPAAGRIDAYGANGLPDVLPPLENAGTRYDCYLGLAHLRYFRSIERSQKTPRVRQRRAIMDWLLSGDCDRPIESHAGAFSAALAFLLYIAVGLALVVLTGIVATIAGGALTWLGVEDIARTETLADFGTVLTVILGLGLALLTLAGLSRWAWEAALNFDLSRADRKGPLTQAFLGAQALVASILLLIALATIPVTALANLGLLEGTIFALLPPSATLILAFFLFGATLVAQPAINRFFSWRAGRRRGLSGPT